MHEASEKLEHLECQQRLADAILTRTVDELEAALEAAAGFLHSQELADKLPNTSLTMQIERAEQLLKEELRIQDVLERFRHALRQTRRQKAVVMELYDRLSHMEEEEVAGEAGERAQAHFTQCNGNIEITKNKSETTLVYWC